MLELGGSMRLPGSISTVGVDGREAARLRKQSWPRRQHAITEPATATAARTPITIPAIAPPLRFFFEEPVLPVVEFGSPPGFGVGSTEGRAII